MRNRGAEVTQKSEKTVDPVSIYLREISKTPLLSMEEEQDLAAKIVEGVAARQQLEALAHCDPEMLTEEELDLIDRLELIALRAQHARDQLAQSNLRLVVSMAKRYLGRGLSLLDLIQEGNLGLLHAVGKFDPTLGYRFSTYATWWIRQSISRAIADKARTIRLPVHVIENVNRQNRVQRELFQQLGREPTPAEIAVEMAFLNEDSLEQIADGHNGADLADDGAAKEVKRASIKVLELQRLNMEPLSLDSPLEGEEQSSLADFVVDEALVDPAPYQPRRDKRRAGLLLKEFAHRVGDPTQGGAARRKPMMTAYRQDALRCARRLAAGPTKLATLRAETGVARAAGILRDDVYGWFVRVERGVYTLSPKGEAALTEFAQALSAL